MSKLTLTQLVNQMQGKSLTYGWDAITLYDQRKANELLFQLYVERFDSETGYFEPMTMLAPWGDGSYVENIYGLKLSAPRLSFETSDPSLPAKARLTMDMIGGMIVSTKKYSGGRLFVSKMLKVLPVGGPTLWMDQPVTKAVVTGAGDVLIDLSNADNFMADFVIGDMTMAAVGQRFKEYFNDNIPSEQKVFPLGRLDGDLNGILTPKNFEVRTMRSDPNALFGDEQYGDGAVILFITLKDGEDGKSYPNANAIYLIPADGGGERYTGTMLLSSRILFDKVMRGPATADIGYGISFLDYTPENGGGSDIGWSLRGASGGLDLEFVHDYRVRDDDFPATFKADLYSHFKADEGGPALTIKGAGTRIEFVWSKTYTTRFSRVIHWSWPTGDEWDYGDLTFVCNYRVNFDVVLDKVTGVVDFNRNEGSSAFNMAVTGFEHLFDLKWEGINMIPKIEEFFRPKLLEILKELSTPTIDTFLLRNLLFPGHNALHLTEAFVPGDLAVFGEIDPLLTSTVLSPRNSTVEAAYAFQFNLSPQPTNVRWSARDVDGQVSLPDVISSSGYFTAPDESQLRDGFLAIVVTAEGTLNGTPVKSSALVSVLSSMIVANPLYDAGDPGEERTFTAQSVNGGTLEWINLTPQWGSRLDPVAGKPHERKYTAGPGSVDPYIPFYMDKIQIKQTVNGKTTSAYIHFLITKLGVTTPMWISEESDPASGTVQFELRGKNGPIDPSRVIWKLLGGVGTFDERTGVYQQPAFVPPGSLVVVSGTVEGLDQDSHALAAVPLPLDRYVELIGTLGKTLKTDWTFD
ncbi:hypothetical protein SAMN04488697_106331 [Pseudomonas sp. 43mfcvi1.1]|uniref:hypothetical protein n=1 Tax=Pseudomonas sp. 43mfcvi1.1 TaxID=1761894 RepID=UPI000D6B4CF2|nr:hypothetical protein [Pseudomonas sp. 43mfcvi1.1]PWJ36502.1 hypothetical protein ATJ40_106331 [Pseudomonas sp. 43mfcvi1.1]SSB97067.1 hypothetical protein SAMN04488697_106331 [Pseudomonas sp. 43mfcvi1.1]